MTLTGGLVNNKTLVLAICVLFVSVPAFGAILSDENAAKDLANKIMTNFGDGNIDNAFNLAKPYTPISATEIDSTALQTKAQLEQYGKRYGEPIGFEFIDSTKIGDSVLRLRYIAKMKNNALPWIFVFYKNAEGWTLNHFECKGNIANLFEGK